MSILALLVTLGVVVRAVIKSKEIPDSLSAIAYVIPHWEFSMWVAVIGILVMPDMMHALSDNTQFIGFLSVVGLFCVAASSYYRTEYAPLHYIGGIMCALCATAVTALIQPFLLLLWSVYLIGMLLMAWRRWCFWAEIVVFTLLVVALNI